MKNLPVIFLSIALFISCETKRNSTADVEAESIKKTAPTLTKIWETDTILKTPESVLFDSDNDVLYVSSIGNVPPTAKDNDGFISKLSISGAVIERNWIGNLHAPKGMGRIGNSLFVTNIDEIVEINIDAGSITNRYPVDSAVFLNDITVSPDSTLYISDTGTNKIHTLKDGKVDLLLQSDKLKGINGLLYKDNDCPNSNDGDINAQIYRCGKLLIATFGSNDFHSMDLKTKKISFLADSLQGGDGVVAYGDDYIVSGWNGVVFHIAGSGEKTTLLDTREAKMNAADIEFVSDKKLLFVPTFFGNTVAAYEVK